MIHIVSFTAEGARLCARLAAELGESKGYAPERYCAAAATGSAERTLLPLEQPVGAWAAGRFGEEALVFVGAAGIAVRAVAPLVRGKGSDPAVLCTDERGQYVIPLLSGHIGGANRLARRIAALTGGAAVITTATDVQGCFSPDDWAAANGCAVPMPEQVKAVSAALLDGEPVGLVSDFPLEGPPPGGISPGRDTGCGILLSLRYQAVFAHTLWLLPRCLRLGIGCRRGVAAEALEDVVAEVLEANGLPLTAVDAAASIDLKAEEAGLLAFCGKHRLPLELYTAGELEQVEGGRSASAFVRQVTGVDNVCERAALARGGVLVVEKTAARGVTVAVAKKEWRARF